jgi:hypothetical protein
MYEPASHALRHAAALEAPSVSEYLPEGQPVQVESEREYVLTGQFWQEPPPDEDAT